MKEKENLEETNTNIEILKELKKINNNTDAIKANLNFFTFVLITNIIIALYYYFILN